MAQATFSERLRHHTQRRHRDGIFRKVLESGGDGNIAVSAVTTPCSIRQPNSIPAQDGPASGNRLLSRTSPKYVTQPLAWCALQSPAPNATRISDTSSTMALRLRTYATA